MLCCDGEVPLGPPVHVQSSGDLIATIMLNMEYPEFSSPSEIFGPCKHKALSRLTLCMSQPSIFWEHTDLWISLVSSSWKQGKHQLKLAMERNRD